MFVRKLTLSNFRVHRVRVALTVAAVALAVSLVVGVTGGYASLQAAAHQFLARYMGFADAQITRREDSLAGGVPQRLVEELREDPAVRRAVGRLERSSTLVDAAGQRLAGHLVHLVGIRRPQDQRVDALNLTAGQWFEGDAGDEAVVDQVVAEALHLGLGDSFKIPGVDKLLTLRVVGIVHKPDVLARLTQTIYLPLRTLQQFVAPGHEPQVNRIMVDLNRGADAQDFASRWKIRLGAMDPLLMLRLASESAQQADQNLRGIELLSYLGGTVSMLAAAFLIFATLSMGVAERTRTLAMLRAVGAFRWQVGALVMLEGLVLAGAGVAVGVPLGWLWLRILAWRFAEFFPGGVVLSAGGVAFAAVGGLLSALLASLLPAWSATRVSALEAMAPLARPPRRRMPLLAAMAGLLLVAIDPALMHGPLAWLVQHLPVDSPRDLTRTLQFYGHFAVGLPALMAGFFLLAPLFVWLTEYSLGPAVAAMLGLRPVLLRQQLSSGMWRAAGTGAALMVGLAVLVVMQTQGRSMLAGWRLPDKFPDIFIISPLQALGPAQIQKLESVPGIAPGRVLPVAIASPQLGNSIFAVGGAGLLPDATIFVGVDPDKMLQMAELEFMEGEPAEAMRLLKQGRHVVITDEYRQLKGLHVGDKLPLKTSQQGTVDYTICGVVWSPGVDVIIGLFDMGRQFEQQTISSVFGSLDDARRDFGVQGVYLVAADLQGGISKEQVLEQLKERLGTWGLLAGDVRQIKHEIQQAFGQLLMLVSTVAFAAMAVASLGVTNTLLASVRSRRWQFGILRAVGVTRWQLVRLVLAEALLLGAVGSGLGLAAGLEMSVNARAFGGAMLGYMPPMLVPWPVVLIGVTAVMAVAALASIWPAVSVARVEPLALLQAGRATA